MLCSFNIVFNIGGMCACLTVGLVWFDYGPCSQIICLEHTFVLSRAEAVLANLHQFVSGD